jgi:hypothetical protein
MRKETFFSLFALLLAFGSCLHAKIIEVSSFKEIVAHVSPDTLILLDIDDTLIIPKQMLGCDDWFNSRIAMHKGDGMDQSTALEKALAEWEGVRHITEMKIVEPGTEHIVSSLQQNGYHIMGLTTQGLALATRTVQQLKQNNIDLSLSAPSKEDFYVSVNGHGVIYRKGILFIHLMSQDLGIWA